MLRWIWSRRKRVQSMTIQILYFLIISFSQVIFSLKGSFFSILIHQYGVELPRDCPLSKLCFKATTTDIEIARTLLDFTWVCNNLTSIKIYWFISLYWRTINHIYVTAIS